MADDLKTSLNVDFSRECKIIIKSKNSDLYYVLGTASLSTLKRYWFAAVRLRIFLLEPGFRNNFEGRSVRDIIQSFDVISSIPDEYLKNFSYSEFIDIKRHLICSEEFIKRHLND